MSAPERSKSESSRRLFVAVVFVVVVATTTSLLIVGKGCDQQSKTSVVVRVGYTPLIYAQPTFVAIERGLFEAEGVEVEVTRFENATQIVNAVIGGELDFCAITPVMSLFAAESKLNQEDSEFKIAYYNLDSIEHPISFLLVKADSEIKTLVDLKGKTIGVFPGNILSKTSAKLLLANHMDVEKDVSFRDVAPNLQAQALGGEIDAMFSLEPYATILTENGVARILHEAPQLSISSPLPAGCGMFSTNFVKQHPDVAQRFYRALEEGIAVIRDDPNFAKSVLPKYTPLNESLALKVRQPEYRAASEMDGKLLQEEYDALVKAGIFNTPFDVRRLIFQNTAK